MKRKLIFTALLAGSSLATFAQQNAKPEDTEIWSPVPAVVTPGKTPGSAPSDAIILFDGKNLDEWVATNDTTSSHKWKVDGKIITVDKTAGDIQTKRKFMDFQLHIEY